MAFINFSIMASIAILVLSASFSHAHPAVQATDPDAAIIATGPDGSIKEQINIPNAALAVLPPVNTNEVELIEPTDPEQEKKVIDAIVKELQTNFAARYQEMLKEKLPGGDYPVRGYSANNGIELNGKITGLENIRLSKAFEASANKSSGLTAYNVKAEMEIPELVFDFDLVKYFPIDVFKLFPVRGKGRANMTAFLPLETKTMPNAQTSTTGCVAAVDAVARADNVRVDVVFTNSLGRGLQWIRDNLNLDLADSVLSNFAKTIVDVIMSILQLIICGAIEAATKAVLVG